jgi:predicted nuclease with RNAse H fold
VRLRRLADSLRRGPHYPERVRTVGVDLATQPNKTAVATIDWTDGLARVTRLSTFGSDAVILAALRSADAAGIDAPFGWPDEFADFISQHRDGTQPPVVGSQDDWRRRLAYRLTDRVIASEFGQHPLSVSTDRIGLTAMRASSLLAQLRDSGEPVDRSGASRIVEVYPAAALRAWGLRSASYKGANRSNLTTLVDELSTAAPWLTLGEFGADCRASDDAFDAVIAALVARAHALGHWRQPAPDQLAQASREGWIVIPTVALAALPG